MEGVKGKLSKLRDDYQDFLKNRRENESYTRLERGVQAIESIRTMTEELSDRIQHGYRALQGTRSLVRVQRGYGSSEQDKKGIEQLRKVYVGNKGIVSRILTRMSGKYPSLREALRAVESTAEGIPQYIEHLSQEIEARREELSYFRSGLRENIEDYIKDKEPLQRDVSGLESEIKNLEEEYNKLETERLENSSGGKETDPTAIRKLSELEIVLGSSHDVYTELETKERLIQSNIDLTNSQIEKVGQLLELLNDARKVVTLAQDFVDIQVPYVLSEIRTQGTQIHALAGVNKAVDFLESQAEVSGIINQRIKTAVEYLDEHVEEVRDRIIEKDDIYGAPNKEKKPEKSGTPKKQLATTSSIN